MFTIHPRPRSSMPGTTAEHSSHGAITLTSHMERTLAGDHSITLRKIDMATLFTRMSTGPSAASACSMTDAAGKAGSVRSAATATRARRRPRPRPPSQPGCGRAACVHVRATSARSAPSWASRSAAARPMPRLPPVTTRPFRAEPPCQWPAGFATRWSVQSTFTGGSRSATCRRRTGRCRRSGCTSRSWCRRGDRG